MNVRAQVTAERMHVRDLASHHLVCELEVANKSKHVSR
jgi:hypothetical protein